MFIKTCGKHLKVRQKKNFSLSAGNQAIMMQFEADVFSTKNTRNQHICPANRIHIDFIVVPNCDSYCQVDVDFKIMTVIVVVMNL